MWSIASIILISSLLLLQPDLGMTIVMMFTWGFQLFITGIPLIIILGILFKRKFQRSQFPLFIALFILVLIIAVISDLPDSVILSASFLFKFLIVLALYFIGSQVNFRTLLQLTKHSMIHIISLWIIISCISLFLVLNFV